MRQDSELLVCRYAPVIGVFKPVLLSFLRFLPLEIAKNRPRAVLLGLLTDHDHGRAQQATVQAIAFLQHDADLVGGRIRGDAHRLM
jgi:hypothetical protein